MGFTMVTGGRSTIICVTHILSMRTTNSLSALILM